MSLYPLLIVDRRQKATPEADLVYNELQFGHRGSNLIPSGQYGGGSVMLWDWFT